MKCFICYALLICSIYVDAAEIKVKNELQVITDEIEAMKSAHSKEVTDLKTEIDNLKKLVAPPTNNRERNEQATLQWAITSMNEIRMEMKELSASMNNSVLLRQLHYIRNQMNKVLMENADLAQQARTHEARLDKLDGEVGRLKYEGQQMRSIVAELRSYISRLTKEIKARQLNEMNNYNEVLPAEDAKNGDGKSEHPHKLRHTKMIHTQISRLARSQEQLDEYQQNLQTQMLDVQRRLDRFEEPNWNLLTAKMEFVELQNKALREKVQNVTEQVADLNKVHASMLELREDVEGVENKIDKIIPEFRKEISKLGVNLAQVSAQISYLREDQENLRQSVKAIAVSVSNTIDRAEVDRDTVKKIGDSVTELKTLTNQHHYRINDHILKSEAEGGDFNGTVGIPLTELMGEVKELQPVEHEYEDLVKQLPKDCSTVPGPPDTYLIHPGRIPVDTWCNNGTTLLQRRFNGSVDFNRKFDDYVNGFGEPSAEFWLGLDNMHELTRDKCTSMRVDMTDIYGSCWYAEYDHFTVGNAGTGYVLNVSGFKGNASNAFEYQNNMEFSAIDRDRDISNTNCAANYEGGWWFSHCQHVNINGKYTLGLTWFDSVRNEWIAVATSEMKIFRRPGCI